MYDEYMAYARTKLDSAELSLPEDLIQHIVLWFLAQNRIPKCMNYFGKFFGRLLVSAYPNFNVDDIMHSQVMTLEYWGGPYYPTREPQWKRMFWADSPRTLIQKMPGEYDHERYVDECADLENDLK
jgi:hypothetical protein